ncbi:MAG: polysaccharide deacetylase family protein [Patescibacteria group bacterium]|nr:polysaccharide deacetylase family protein [Patescibacteria group bacterium]
MEKTFTLRVDLESDKGIRKGLPEFLDLLAKYKMKASFYLVMGGESNIFELLRNRKKLSSSGERKINVWSLRDKARMVLLPKNFVRANKKILKRILKEGHELGVHGWKHRAWTRNLNNIDIQEHILKAKREYVMIFNREPTSFAAPGFNTNKKVLEVLEKSGIKFISDFVGEKPAYYGKMKNIPITICGKDRTPIIEHLISIGKRDDEILKIMKKEIKKRDLASFYIHGLFEARFKRDLLEDIFKSVKRNGIKNKRIIDYCEGL